MGCIYSNYKGNCTLKDDENVTCDYECDPDPSYGCEYYESDYVCDECGVDLNVEECKCNFENN